MTTYIDHLAALARRYLPRSTTEPLGLIIPIQAPPPPLSPEAQARLNRIVDEVCGEDCPECGWGQVDGHEDTCTRR